MIGFLGGTGPEGRGLALRLALAGEDVIIGSRDGSRAAAAAEEVAGLAPGAVVEGALNEETAARADVVFIAVPYSAQRPTISFGLPLLPIWEIPVENVARAVLRTRTKSERDSFNRRPSREEIS